MPDLPPPFLFSAHCALLTQHFPLSLFPKNFKLMTTIDVKKEQRGVKATQTAATAAGAKTFTAEEKNTCSIDAMLNGGTCEACQ